MFKHKLGAEATDKITGFLGIVTSRAEFLTGCNRYCLQPRGLVEGKIIESQYFDEAQLEVVGDGISSVSVTDDDNPGACSPDAAKQLRRQDRPLTNERKTDNKKF